MRPTGTQRTDKDDERKECGWHAGTERQKSIGAAAGQAQSALAHGRQCASQWLGADMTFPGRLELPTLRLTASRWNQMSNGSTCM